MTVTRRTWLLVLSVLSAVAVAVTVVVSVSRDTPGGEQHGPGDAEHGIEGPMPEGADAHTAAVHALTAMFSWQPVVDESPGAGLVRARPWLTGELAATADSSPGATSGVRPLPDWQAWRESRDVIRAAVTEPTVTTTAVDGECLVAATVTQTVHHLDNTRTPYRRMTVSAVMRDTGNGWRLAHFVTS